MRPTLGSIAILYFKRILINVHPVQCWQVKAYGGNKTHRRRLWTVFIRVGDVESGLFFSDNFCGYIHN